MKLEEQVVSLKLAKKLKELEVEQESYFVWVEGVPFFDGNHSERDLVLNPNDLLELTDNCDYDFEMASAFTVAELGEILNTELTDQNENDSFTLQCANAIDFWAVAFGNDGITITPQFENAKLADSLAEILIYLLENNLIEVPS